MQVEPGPGLSPRPPSPRLGVPVGRAPPAEGVFCRGAAVVSEAPRVSAPPAWPAPSVEFLPQAVVERWVLVSEQKANARQGLCVICRVQFYDETRTCWRVFQRKP